jgi:hypothetical protein
MIVLRTGEDQTHKPLGQMPCRLHKPFVSQLVSTALDTSPESKATHMAQGREESFLSVGALCRFESFKLGHQRFINTFGFIRSEIIARDSPSKSL